MTDEEIDFIANEGRRNALGGIYATRVYEFARAIEKATLDRTTNVSAGWKLVPIEPTKKMIFEAQRYVWVAEEDANEAGIWKSMIAAAPESSQAQNCHLCDNTGDIHDATGEWRGECPYCDTPKGA